jgi:hypothetical protein
MARARLLVAVLGILLPYLARLPRGMDWLAQYTHAGLAGFLFLGAFNAIAWLAIIAISWAYRRPASILAPALPGFAVLAWAHHAIDLSADAQAAVALIFVPIHALPAIAIGGVLGYLVDRRMGRPDPGATLG